MHSETRTQTPARPVTHAPGVYTRMPIIPLARPRPLGSHVLPSSSLSPPSRLRGSSLLILDLLNLNIQIQRTLAVRRAHLPFALILIYAFLYARYLRVSLVCFASFFFFFFTPSLTAAGDDLFTAEYLAGKYFSRSFKGFASIFPFESRIISVIRSAEALRAHEAVMEGLSDLIAKSQLKNGDIGR